MTWCISLLYIPVAIIVFFVSLIVFIMLETYKKVKENEKG